jgi:hypothetical protein
MCDPPILFFGPTYTETSCRLIWENRSILASRETVTTRSDRRHTELNVHRSCSVSRTVIIYWPTFVDYAKNNNQTTRVSSKYMGSLIQQIQTLKQRILNLNIELLGGAVQDWKQWLNESFDEEVFVALIFGTLIEFGIPSVWWLYINNAKRNRFIFFFECQEWRMLPWDSSGLPYHQTVEINLNISILQSVKVITFPSPPRINRSLTHSTWTGVPELCFRTTVAVKERGNMDNYE